MDGLLADGAWSCPQCTLLNQLGSSACSACGWVGAETLGASGLSDGGATQAEGSTGWTGVDQQKCRAAVESLWDLQSIAVLLTLVGNAADNPEDPKFRGPVRKSNAKIRAAVVDTVGAAEVLQLAGFQEDADSFCLTRVRPERLSRVRELLGEQQRVVAAVQQPAAKAGFSPPARPAAQRAPAPGGSRCFARAEPSQASPPVAEQPHAPATSSAPARPPRSMRLRLRLPLGGRLELEVQPGTTVAALGAEVCERTGVRPHLQRVRFGFPSRVLRAQGDELLGEAGIQDGEVLHLENLRDLFLTNLEAGALTMEELMGRLPPGEQDGEGSMGALFREAIEKLGVELGDRNFWRVVHGQILRLVSGEMRNEAQVASLRSGLFVLQRLFQDHDPGGRLSLVLNCVPGRVVSDRTVLRPDRSDLLASVAPQVLKLDRRQLLSKVFVQYVGERGIDEGGLTRDFFSSFGACLGEGAQPLWRLTGRGSLRPVAPRGPGADRFRHPSGLSADELYRACGRVFALAVLHQCKLGRQLSHSFLRVLVGDTPHELADLQAELAMEAGDATDFRAGRQILDRPLAEIGLAGELNFAYTPTDYPEAREVELIPGGIGLPVTDENKAVWLRTVLRHELVVLAEPAAASFRQGLIDVFGGGGGTCPLLCLLSVDNLLELWGKGSVRREEVAKWRAVARVSPAVAQQGRWLWQVLEDDYDDELRGKVLQFATGASSIDRWGLRTFLVEPADGGDERLPSAMTCGHMLQLPRYSCRAVLAKKLRTAAEMCGSFANR